MTREHAVFVSISLSIMKIIGLFESFFDEVFCLFNLSTLIRKKESEVERKKVMLNSWAHDRMKLILNHFSESILSYSILVVHWLQKDSLSGSVYKFFDSSNV